MTGYVFLLFLSSWKKTLCLQTALLMFPCLSLLLRAVGSGWLGICLSKGWHFQIQKNQCLTGVSHQAPPTSYLGVVTEKPKRYHSEEGGGKPFLTSPQAEGDTAPPQAMAFPFHPPGLHGGG